MAAWGRWGMQTSGLREHFDGLSVPPRPLVGWTWGHRWLREPQPPMGLNLGRWWAGLGALVDWGHRWLREPQPPMGWELAGYPMSTVHCQLFR